MSRQALSLALLLTLLLPALVGAADPPGIPPGRPQVPLAGNWQRQLVKAVTDQPGEQWTTIALPKGDTLTKDTNGVWYQREVEVPAAWQGQQVVMHIGKCYWGVTVYCNGAKAGEIPAYGGDVDLTALLKFGQSNVLRLFLGRLGQGLTRLDKVSQCIAEYFAQRDTTGTWLTAGLGLICTPAEFCLEARPRLAFVEDVWYQTYTRGMQRVEPVLTFQASQPLTGARAQVTLFDPAGGAPVQDRTFDLKPIPLGSSQQRLVIPATGLKRWALREPNLYLGQVTLLTAEGEVLDRTAPVAFGLREFWANGKDWYLNGAPVYFVNMGQPSETNIDEFMRIGCTLYTHGVPYWGRFLNEDMVPISSLLDRKGAGYVPTGVSMSQLNLNDPEVLRDYALWTKAHARRLQNHPSILIYGLGFNTPGSSPDFIPTKVGVTWNTDWSNALTTLAYQYSLRADPTRAYYYYGGARAPATWSANFYPNHTQNQEVEEWFSLWHERGDKPVITFECTTGTIGAVDYEKGGTPYATEYGAILAGDTAYTWERDEYLSYATHVRNRQDFWSFEIADTAPEVWATRNPARVRTTRAWRFWGVPFWNWDYMDEVYAGSKRPTGPQDRDGLRKPSLAWIGGPPDQWPAKDHNFYSGEQITKSLMIIRDLSGQATWKAVWEARLAGSNQPFASGHLEPAVGAYARMKVPFSFTAPAVTKPTAATLSLVVSEGTAEIAKDAFALTFYPRPTPPQPKTAFAIYDPRGDTTAWLKARGAALQPYDPAARQQAPPAVLLLGREALQGLKTLPFTAEQVAKGMRVVIFEQHCNDLGNLGLQHEDTRPRQVYVRQPASPLALGLTSDGLRDWQGSATLCPWGPDHDRLAVSSRTGHAGNRGNVATDIIETPHFGSFSPILDCEFDLGYTPLLTWRHGAGEVIFCQLDLTGRVGSEPGAGLVADNLLRYLNAPPKLAQVKTALCLDQATAQALDARGFAAAVWSTKPDPAKHLVVVTGAQAEAFAARRQQVVDFAKAGGQVLVLYAGDQLLSDPAFGGKLKAAKTRFTRAGTVVDKHPLLMGVGPQNIHWREPIELVKLESTDPKFTSLLSGLMGVLPEGKGSFVFFQVDPVAMADLTLVKAEDAKLMEEWKAKNSPLAAKTLPDTWFQRDRKRSRWQLNKLHSLILTNLGVDSSPALSQRLFSISRAIGFTPVNAWVMLGPIPPADGLNSDAGGDPLARPDLAELASHRDLAWRMPTPRGGTIGWVVPTDSQNGLGLDGKMDMAKIWGVRVRDLGIAVTYLWSTRAREATIGVGADWWLRVLINGEQVYDATKDGFAIGFDKKVVVKLKPGWNEVLCYLGAGSNGHYFNFEITNPGDLVVAQQLTAPTAKPEGIPPESELLPDKVEPGFNLYTEPLVANDDPYAYYAW